MNIVPTKLRYYTDKGATIRGVIHVGMSWGEEIADYLAFGATHVIGFEPLKLAYTEAVKLYGDDPRVVLANVALGHHNERRTMTIVDDKEPMVGHPVGTGGSSFLEEVTKPEGTPERYLYGQRDLQIFSFEAWFTQQLELSMEDYNALVIDVQGMELDVLKGFGEYIKHIQYANIECSRVPVYRGEAPAQEIVDWMVAQGFTQDTPIEDHNDILFSRH